MNSGFYTFCCNCHRLKISAQEFVTVSEVVRARLEPEASHGICAPCAAALYGIDVTTPAPVRTRPVAQRVRLSAA